MGAFKNAVQNYGFFLIRTNIFSSFVHALIETDMKRHVNNLGIYAVCLAPADRLSGWLDGQQSPAYGGMAAHRRRHHRARGPHQTAEQILTLPCPHAL